MSNSQSLLAYPDVKEALDRVLLGKGLRILFKDHKAAVRFVARCNAFRMLDRKENAKLYEFTNSMHGRSIYDPLKITRIERCVVVVPITLEVESITELDPPHDGEVA
jgi:hypothetical protein